MEAVTENDHLNCTDSKLIHTIGHSTRALDDFIELLKVHRVERLIDVRRWPASRRYPHFQREMLAASLREVSIEYIWRGDLGGFRKPSADSPNRAWKVETFRAYADFMLTPEFAKIMKEIESLAEKKPAALMCAEAVPWRCHRQLLADAFLVRHWSVRHILEDGCHAHELPAFARLEGMRIFYSGKEGQ
jgi:uncharacterized protein (DUF488 family)